MSYENLRQANFMQHIVKEDRGSGNFAATHIETVDQGALREQLLRRKYARPCGRGVGPLLARMPEDWEGKFNLQERIIRRGDRGGSNLGALDAPPETR